MGGEGQKDPGKTTMGGQGYDVGGGDEGGCVDGRDGDAKFAFLGVALLMRSIYLV